MPHQIWKYPLKSNVNVSEIEMPVRAKILSVGTQHGNICMWAYVDTNEKRTRVRRFVVCPTGEDIPQNAESFLGTVKLYDGALIFHVFEVKEDTQE